MKRRGGDVESWIKEAIEKGYSPQRIRELLLKKGFNNRQILRVLSVYERLKDKIRIIPKPVPKEIPDTRVSIPKITPAKPRGEAIESYQLEIDKAKVEIRIERTIEGVMYGLYVPEVDIGTRALLEEIRKELIAVTAIAVGEIVDQKSIQKIKNRFMRDAGKMLKDKIPTIPRETEDFLIGILMQEMLGLEK